MSSEMQDCLFPNLGIVINMKPTDVCIIFHSRKGIQTQTHCQKKTRTYLVMPPYLIKAMRKLYVFNNIVYQKYEPTQSSKLICLLPI